MESRSSGCTPGCTRFLKVAERLGRYEFDWRMGKGLEDASMHEYEKLEEARHFLERMRQAAEPKAFQYELSAFLSAARSALQYALKEATTKTGGQKWYD